MADAWVEALATTEIHYDKKLIPDTANVGDGLRATVAAVRRRHPGLAPLEIVGVPNEVLKTKPELRGIAAQDALAGDVVFMLSCNGVFRIEIDDRHLFVVQCKRGEASERLLIRYAQEEQLWRALETGRADTATLDIAATTLRRARLICVDSSYHISHLLALEVIKKSPGAVARFSAIARQGTAEGRLYAMMGMASLSALPVGWDTTWERPVWVALGDQFSLENAADYFRRMVQAGTVPQRIAYKLYDPDSPAQQNRVTLPATIRREMKVAASAPAKRGHILFDEIDQGFGLQSIPPAGARP